MRNDKKKSHKGSTSESSKGKTSQKEVTPANKQSVSTKPMPTVYGVANHTPDQTFLWLQHEYNVQTADVTVVPVGSKLPHPVKKKIRKVIFFLTVSDFNANAERLELYSKHTVFLFASALRLWEYVGITALDYKESDDPQRYGIQLFDKFFTIKDLYAAAEIRVQRPNRTYLTRILEETRSFGSLLRPLMTFIYTMPSATHQRPVKVSICQWLYYAGSEKDLNDILQAVDKQIKLTERHKLKLRDLLLSEQGDKYRAAFIKYRQLKDENKTPSYDSLTKEFEVSPFEMRYIKSVIDSKDKHADSENVTIHEIVSRMLKRKPTYAALDKKSENKAESKVATPGKTEKGKAKEVKSGKKNVDTTENTKFRHKVAKQLKHAKQTKIKPKTRVRELKRSA